MLKRKKQIIAKVMATTMLASTLASTFTTNVSAAEQQTRATVSETTIAGDDRYKTAVEISKNYSSTSKHAVIVNGQKGIVDALTATPYASLKKAPILMTQSTKLNADTKNELTRRGVKTVDIVGGVNSVSDSVKAEIEAMGITVNRIAGDSKYNTALEVAKKIDAISDISEIAVANGEVLADAVSVAAPAAQNKMPIILAHPTKGLDEEVKKYIDSRAVTTSYVIGGKNSVSTATQNTLPGTKKRLEGTDRQGTNASVIEEFYTDSSYDNIYVTKSGQVNKADEIADALAVGVLAASNEDPVMLVGKSLGSTQKTLLEDKEVEKITKVGNGIPTASINAIKDTQKEVESKVTSVTFVNNKTIDLNGSDLNLIGKTNIEINGNSVATYTVNSSGTKATVVFNNVFAAGTNTVKVKSNLGNSTSHNFTYKVEVSDINTVEATTSEVSINGIQYLEFTVNNGITKTIEELKLEGWNVKFKSSKEIFYKVDNGELTTSSTSTTGKLQTVENFDDKSVFDYEVILTKGDKEVKSKKVAVVVKDRSNDVKEIKSYELTFGTNSDADESILNSSTLLVGENVKVNSLNVVNLNGSESKLEGGYTVESENPNVLTVVDDEILEAKEAGTSKIKISIGDKTTEFTLTVKNVSGNERIAKSASFSTSSIKLIEGDDVNVTVTIKDQYGDPIVDADIDETDGLFIPEVKNSKKQLIASATEPVYVEGNLKGEYETTISVDFGEEDFTTTQSGTLKVQYLGDDLTGSLSINVSPIDIQTVSTKKIEIDKDSVSKDFTIDRYLTDSYGDDQDNELDLVLNGYSKNGYLVEEGMSFEDIEDEDGNEIKYSVESSNTKIAKVAFNDSKDKIEVRCDETSEVGTVSIKLYEHKGSTKKQIGSTISVTVKDSIPTITDLNLKTVSNITSLKEDGVEFTIEDLFDITKVNVLDEDGEPTDVIKNVVNGVTLTGLQSQLQKEVLLGLDEDESTPILFLDNGDGLYDSEDDELLMTIKLQTDRTIDNISSNSGYEVDLEEKDGDQNGNIIVRLYHGEYTNTKPVYKSVTIAVNIEE